MKSKLHKKLQEIVRDYYKGKEGWIAIVEESIRGKKVDVLAQEIKSKYTVANEIQVSYKHFLENIMLDLKANCDEVRIISADPKVLEQMEEKASKKLDRNFLVRVRFQLIQEFIPIKTIESISNTAEFNTEDNPETNAEENGSVVH